MPRIADPHRRNDILAAARATFLARGYTQTRIADIAARAGVAPGTIYLYFDSKEAIVLELAEHIFRQLHTVTLEALAHEEASEALSAAVHAALVFVQQERDLVKLVKLNLGLNPDLRESSARHALLMALAAHLADRMQRGQILSYQPQILAELIINMIERTAEPRLLSNEGGLDDYEQVIIALLHQALIAIPSTDGRAEGR